MHHKQNFSCHSFADDTNILVSSSDLNELNSKLNSVLCCISKWFQNNLLVLNLNKTHIVKFAFSKLLTYPLNIVYNNQAFTITENIKFLGTHLDCNLIWKSHIDNLIKKLNSICFILRKLLPIVQVHRVRKRLYPFLFFFLGAQCVESGVSCTDCYYILLVLIEIPAVPVGTKC